MIEIFRARDQNIPFSAVHRRIWPGLDSKTQLGAKQQLLDHKKSLGLSPATHEVDLRSDHSRESLFDELIGRALDQ
jgi:hypothetical protein